MAMVTKETRVWIAQCLCPERHAILAAAGEAAGPEDAENKIARPLRDKIEELLADDVLNPWCGICRAPRETWKLEIGRTRWTALSDIKPELEKGRGRKHRGGLNLGRAARPQIPYLNFWRTQMQADRRLGDAPIEQRYRRKMQELVALLDRYFNSDKRGAARETGFVLLVFPFGEHEGRCNFISNGANRADLVVLFREMIARFEGQPEMQGRA